MAPWARGSSARPDHPRRSFYDYGSGKRRSTCFRQELRILQLESLVRELINQRGSTIDQNGVRSRLVN